MADIFISYSSDDRAVAARLAEYVQEQSYSVWWDREICGGQQIYSEIDQALAKCKIVIVIWTSSSIKSRWVLGEAETAAGTKILIPVRDDHLAQGQVPVGFRALRTIPLSQHDELLRAIHSSISAPRKPLNRWDVLKMRLAYRLGHMRRRLTFARVAVSAIVISFSLYAAMMLIRWETIKGSMEPDDFKQYLRTFPYGPLAWQARAKLDGADRWETIKSSRNIGDLQRYLDNNQNSLYSIFVRPRIARLQAVGSGSYTRLLPEASLRTLTPDDVSRLDCNSLWIARNEIFYSLGFCFLSDKGMEFFKTELGCPYNSCTAVQKINSLTQDIISKTENDNINLISKREKAIGCLVPAARSCGYR